MAFIIKKKRLQQFSVLLSFFGAAFLMMIGLSVTTYDVTGVNISNQTVIARVNVSNQFPVIYNVKIDHPLDSDGNVDLQAGSNVTVVCNASYQDTNGFDDITGANATLYFDATGPQLPDDNNTHYSNISCGADCQVIPGSSNQNGSCTCQFAVQYFANYGNWRCNMTITDGGGLSDDNVSGLTFFNEIVGINLNNLTIDYGELSVTDISTHVPKNITNVGNVPMNVSVRGYGGTNESEGQNVTMICEAGSTNNITFGNHRYSLEDTVAYVDMYNLTNQTLQIPDLTIAERQEDTELANSTNVTYWRLQVPLGAAGICNGTIIFGAVDARGN